MNFVLGVNIDHIATIRNARGEDYPNLMEMTALAINAGADQITAHLREDRRHILDKDIVDLKNNISVPLNMEIANTEEMIAIALKVKPFSVCLVPEKREEITTEGGLNLISNELSIKNSIDKLQDNDIKVSLFIDPHQDNIEILNRLNPYAVEINTGVYSNLKGHNSTSEAEKIMQISKIIHSKGIHVHAGHGLNLNNIHDIAKITDIIEFNIGHFLVSYGLQVGFKNAIIDMKNKIKNARNSN